MACVRTAEKAILWFQGSLIGGKNDGRLLDRLLLVLVVVIVMML